MSLNSIFTALANKVRQLAGRSDKLGITEMTSHISDANEKIAAQGELIEKIRAAIVGKETGGSGGRCEFYFGTVNIDDVYNKSITIESEAEIGDEDFLMAYLAEEMSISEESEYGAAIRNHNTMVFYLKRFTEARYVTVSATGDNYGDEEYDSIMVDATLTMNKSRTFSAQRNGNTIVFTDEVNVMYGSWDWMHIKIK